MPTQGGIVGPHPLIPGLVGVGGPGHVLGGGGNARKTSAPPTMMNGVPYRPLGIYHPHPHPHHQQHPIGGPILSGIKSMSVSTTLVDAQTQTISTGDITVLGVYYDDEQTDNGRRRWS